MKAGPFYYFATFPAMFSASQVRAKGGAYIKSSKPRVSVVNSPVIAAANVSMRKAAPFSPAICPPKIRLEAAS